MFSHAPVPPTLVLLGLSFLLLATLLVGEPEK
jgi:hypothetical protein